MAIQSTNRCLSNRVCDIVVAFFALWTIVCISAVLLGASLVDLITAFVIASILVIGLVGLFAKKATAITACGQTLPEGTPPASRSERTSHWVSVSGIACGAVVLTFYARSHSFPVLWWGAVSLLLFAGLSMLAFDKRPFAPPSIPESRRAELGLWAIGILCAILTLVTHRPSTDDIHYMNRAVTACDNADQSALAAYGDFDLDVGASSVQQYYVLQTLEPLMGGLAWVTGIPVAYCFHWCLAAFMGLLVPLAHARLLRILVPDYWLWCVIAVLVVLIGLSPSSRWYGNFAFDRIWQGKSIYINVFLPLAFAYGIEFGFRPCISKWLLLAAIQIASVGCTVSALGLVPISVMLAVTCSVKLNRRTSRTTLLAMLASVFVVAAGALLKNQLGDWVPSYPSLGQARQAELPATPPERSAQADTHTTSSVPAGALSRLSYEAMMGQGGTMLWGAAALMMTWGLLGRGMAQRFAIIVPLGALLLIMNPYLEGFVKRNIVGLHWRTMWALPLPILMALMLTAPLQIRRRLIGKAVVLVPMAALLWAAPRTGTLNPRNLRTQIHWPTLKFSEPHYSRAQHLYDSVPRRARILAPPRVSMYLLTMHDHPSPLHTAGQTRWLLRNDDTPIWRVVMTEAVTARGTYRERTSVRQLRSTADVDALEIFGRGLEKYDVTGVLIDRAAPNAAALRQMLDNAGFLLVTNEDEYEIWVRASDGSQ